MSAYIPISSQTLASSASSVTFSSIPGIYRDLVLVANYTISSSANVLMRVNSDTGANYFYAGVWSNGGSVSNSGSGGSSVQIVLDIAGSTQANQRQQATIQIIDYSQTNKHKGMLIRKDDPTTRGTLMMSGRWGITSALTSVTFYNATFVAGSTFSLYGVLA
jgi:hypothetical protein